MPDLSAPLFDILDPVPYQGRSKTTREASASGARQGQQDRGSKLQRVREAYRQPRTMQSVADITGLPLSSVCSLTAALRRRGEIEAVGSATVQWSGRSTKRTKWQVKETR